MLTCDIEGYGLQDLPRSHHLDRLPYDNVNLLLQLHVLGEPELGQLAQHRPQQRGLLTADRLYSI